MRNLRRQKLISFIANDYLEAATVLRASTSVMVYVEGYEDVTFWRSIFDEFESEGEQRKFEVTTPSRSDLAKGKKVVLSFADRAGKHLILCVDSDFDFLMANHTECSKIVNNNPFVVQTYLYAIENLLCLPSSLDSIATRITRNDAQIFDFEAFCASYSVIIFPLFVWYYYAAKSNQPQIFTLSDFRNTIKLNYIELEDGAVSTLSFIERQTERRLKVLERKHPVYVEAIESTKLQLFERGVSPDKTCLYIQGHTWQDSVVKVLLSTVCNALREMIVDRIERSTQQPLTRRNDMSSYNNSLRDIESVVADNTLYRRTAYYKPIADKISSIVKGESGSKIAQQRV